MRGSKVWVFGIVLGLSLGVTATWLATSYVNKADAARPEVKDHWRNHDGHWSYWHEGDQRWYYTDGKHWYWHEAKEGGPWKLYTFDKEHKFGLDFMHGDYKAPGANVKIELPVHRVFVK